MRTRAALTVLAMLALAACGGDEESSLRADYLAEIDAADPDFFVNDDAALAYVKNVCENVRSGATPDADRIDEIAVSYCDTDLAAELGVAPAPAAPTGVDEDAFRAEALERFDLGGTESDGSSLDAAALAQSFCENSDDELEQMRSNLGASFSGSFQEFALQTFCPDRL